MKIIIVAVAAIIVIAGAWWIFTNGKAPAVVPDTQTTVSAGDVSWQYKDAGTDTASGAPQTHVSATVGSKTYDVGTYDGSCAPVASLYAGEISGVLCWYAGGGKEAGVFEEGDKYVIKEGDQDEGSAEEVGFRGNFKTLFELN